jgi:predicted HicB family RNase H-like nuclease
VRVDADLHHRLKLRAVEERRSLADLVEEILRRDLGRRKGGAR